MKLMLSVTLGVRILLSECVCGYMNSCTHPTMHINKLKYSSKLVGKYTELQIEYSENVEHCT